jgi:hypothetical protein
MSVFGSSPTTLVVNTNANGALINAVNGTAYAVLGFCLSSNNAVAVKLQTNTTDVTGAIRIAAGGTVPLPAGSVPLCRTTAGDPLNLNISVATGAAIITGTITYITL